jgi:PPOX class probable FMN-dependent enzyme
MTAPGPRFVDVITSEAELEAVLGRPNPRVAAKVVTALDAHCQAFIGRSPFVLIGSADAAGNLDMSPRGDPPGFVRILDDTTLAIPDRPGNRRADTFRNVLQNAKVGLIFLVPGKRETLRVSGDARIVRDTGLRAAMAVDGRLPDLALVVSVKEAFIHCAKCMIRSRLWEPGHWPASADLPSLAAFAIAHAGIAATEAEVEAVIDADERTRLY